MERLHQSVLFKQEEQQTGQRVSTGHDVQREGVEIPLVRLAQVALADAVVALVEQGDHLRGIAQLHTPATKHIRQNKGTFIVKPFRFLVYGHNNKVISPAQTSTPPAHDAYGPRRTTRVIRACSQTKSVGQLSKLCTSFGHPVS